MGKFKFGLIIAAFAGAIISGYALAQPAHPFTRTYYSDASETVAVGFQYQGCTRGWRSGQITPYYETVIDEDSDCL